MDMGHHIELWELLTAAWPEVTRSWPEAAFERTRAVYLDAMQDLPGNDVLRAAKALVRCSRTFPTVADIRAAAALTSGAKT